MASNRQHGQGELSDFRKSGHLAKVDSQYYTVFAFFFLSFQGATPLSFDTRDVHEHEHLQHIVE